MTESWTGIPVLARDGAALGVVEDAYPGSRGGGPEFALISNGSAPGQGDRSTFVPLAGSSWRDGALVLGFDGAQVAAAPVAQPVDRLTPEVEEAIYAQFGLTRPDPAADAMTVSEEQLVVDTVPVPREHVRVRKQVVEDQVTVTVTLRREELLVERVPVTDPAAVVLEPGTEVGEAEMSFVLLAEEPVVGKRVVPVEQVQIRKDIVKEERTVSDDVRRERVDVESLPAASQAPPPPPPPPNPG